MIVDEQVEYFLDTNILVYAYDNSAGKKHTLAAQLIKDCWEYENGFLSIQVLQEFYVTVTQKITAPLDRVITRQIVADLAQWRLQCPDKDDLLRAMDLQQSYRLSFWDAMIVQSASQMGCKQLLSEDFNHEQVFGEVRVINPFK